MVRWLGGLTIAAAMASGQAMKPLENATVTASATALTISNHSGDPWLEMRIAVTEHETYDAASSYVCWGDRLDARESLTSKLDTCVDAHGRRFVALGVKPRVVSITAHVPEHGYRHSLFPLK